MVTLAEALHQAMQYHQAGRFTQAEQLYRQILTVDASHADALHLLGVLAAQEGRYDQAIDLIRQAVRINPRVAAFHSNLGSALRDSGRLDEAVDCYRQALALESHFATAHNNLGTGLAMQGKRDEAVFCYRQALRLQPDNAAWHFDLATALLELGRLPEAVASYQQVVYLQPDHVVARNNLDNALARLGAGTRLDAEALFNQGNDLLVQDKLDQAIACYRQTLDQQPNHAGALNNLGVALNKQGRLDEAVSCYREALRLKPDYAGAYNNLGHALRDQGKREEVVHSYRQAQRLEPGVAERHYNLANALQEVGQLGEAIDAYEQALRLEPDHVDALNNLGNALARHGKLSEALARYRHVVRLRPDHAEAYNNLGSALHGQGHLDEAVGCFELALRLKPDFVDAHNNLGNVLVEMGQIAKAMQCFQHAVQLQPGYVKAYNNLGNALKEQGRVAEAVQSYREALRRKPDYALAHSNLLFVSNYDPQADPDTVFADHCRWDALHGQIERLALHNSRDPERRLRIGYVSPDLRRHPVTRYVEPVLAHHDREQVELFCYAEVAAPDAMTAHLQGLVHHWRWTCGRGAAEVAEAIRADGIDILVDLAGHTAGNRLDVFARKPAPVQVTWLGYMNTSGLRAMDYRLTDEVVDPPGQPVRDTEKLYRLPGGMCCFAPPEDAPALSALPARRNGYLTFGSLHTLPKVNRAVIDLWCRVLHALPTARLLMFRHTLVGETRAYLHRQFIERGITSDRLDLRQGSSTPGYLSVYDEIDLTLDVFPYTGGTTTCEALWMGAPVLSLSGVRPAARGSAGLLACVGLRDWIVETPEAYLALAERWASDLDGLAAVRAGLRERMRATLCDARRFTRELEEAYRTMWRRWCTSPV